MSDDRTRGGGTSDSELSPHELVALVERVFAPGPEDRALAVLVDLPDDATPDTEAWRQRRRLAADWAARLAEAESATGLAVRLVLYRNVRMNNAQLPDSAWFCEDGDLPETADALSPADAVTFEEVFRAYSIMLAPTQFSATAPLKLAARQYGFRAATMPGFSPEMVPALRLDYGVVNRRVDRMKALLDPATAARFLFRVDGSETYRLTLDLRHREAHASGGLLPTPGMAGNLPSGEAYIVPYEGERSGDPSRSEGVMPVEFPDGVALYRIERNRALTVAGDEAAARRETARLIAEPAYGNIAELGLGVLGDFGVGVTGEILLDEKLGLHIAFGRSDHFGGQVGVAQFSRPEAVVHIDRVYLPALQPRIVIETADLVMPGGDETPLMRDGAYVVTF